MPAIKPGDEIHVVIDAKDGTIVATTLGRSWLPLMATDPATRMLITDYAQKIATEQNRPLIIRRYVRTSDKAIKP